MVGIQSDKVSGLTAAELGSREWWMLAFPSLSAFYSAQDPTCPGSDWVFPPSVKSLWKQPHKTLQWVCLLQETKCGFLSLHWKFRILLSIVLVFCFVCLAFVILFFFGCFFCLFNLFFCTKGLKVFVLQTCTMVTWNLTHRVDPSRKGIKSLFSTGKVIVDKLSSPMTHAISVWLELAP